MMPASNRALGGNVGFPDVKLTPAAPAPLPIPYPNLAPNTLAAVFSPNIYVGYVPQLSLASITPMTLGNQAGVLHPLFMMAGGQTAGNPRVLINCIPAKHLCVPTWGNLFNNPVGMVAAPSVTSTHYSDREEHARGSQDESPLSAHALRCLASARDGAGTVEAKECFHRVLWVRISRFAPDVGTRVWNEFQRRPLTAMMVFDLRGNPGGDADAAMDLAGEFLPRGTDLGAICGQRMFAPHEQTYEAEILVLVDRLTASAAELFAGTLQAHRRATVIGQRTYGKSTVQSGSRCVQGGVRYATVGETLLPGGQPFDPGGLIPDLLCEPSGVEVEAANVVAARGLR